MESVNTKLIELRDYFVYELLDSQKYSSIPDLKIIPVKKLSEEMSPIYFLDRPFINKWAGSYSGTIFSKNKLHYRKYLLKQSFALDKLRNSL